MFALNLIFEFQTFLTPKKCANSNCFATSPYTGLSVLYGDVVIFAMRRLSCGEKGPAIKKSFSMGNSRFFGLHDFSKLEIQFFLRKNSGYCHGSVELRKTLFKALRTSIGAE